jgi:hypothetical protein
MVSTTGTALRLAMGRPCEAQQYNVWSIGGCGFLKASSFLHDLIRSELINIIRKS